tara:strand:- start:47 stop:187 length:141 start_codon:yes stop_codon:yes gene_type:complete
LTATPRRIEGAQNWFDESIRANSVAYVPLLERHFAGVCPRNIASFL